MNEHDNQYEPGDPTPDPDGVGEPAKQSGRKFLVGALAGSLLVILAVIAVMTTGDDATTVAAEATPSPSASATPKPSTKLAEAETDLFCKLLKYGEAVVSADSSDARKAEHRATVAERCPENSAALEVLYAALEPLSTNPADYAAISSRDWALVVKDPAAHAGEKYVIYSRVFQFDAATGTDSFLGFAESAAQSSDYNYEQTVMFRGDPAILAPVVKDDIVRVYVAIKGAYTYDRATGGSNTVPEATVGIIQVIG